MRRVHGIGSCLAVDGYGPESQNDGVGDEGDEGDPVVHDEEDDFDEHDEHGEDGDDDVEVCDAVSVY